MLCFKNVCRHINKRTLSSAESFLISSAKSKDDIQIVIIGAGLAGLSAANHLIVNGFNRTILLEATDRYGGRVNTQQFGDAYCELGAKWVPINPSKHSMYDVVQKASGLQKKVQPKSEPLYVNTQGEKANRMLTEHVEAIYRKLSKGIELEEKYKTGALDDLNNVHTYFQAEARKFIQSLFAEQDQRLANDIFNSLFKEFGGFLGCCLEYVNIEHITKLNGHNASVIYIPNGLDNLLRHVADNVDPNQHMKVGKPVGEIKWYGVSTLDQKSVGCLDGSLFPADHIICTLPLGVLKTFSTYIFRPVLPKEKLQAIRNLGFGCPVKMYFEYDKDIQQWFTGTPIRPIWSEEERLQNIAWPRQVVEISKLPTSTRVLEISIGGEFHEQIEKLPDAEVSNEITGILRTFLKNPKVPHPTAMLRSNWNSSATYLGGRPYFSTQSSERDVNMLAEPLGDTPSLLFAGDATIVNGFGTLDGARKSGIREADRIIDYYKRLPA